MRGSKIDIVQKGPLRQSQIILYMGFGVGEREGKKEMRQSDVSV